MSSVSLHGVDERLAKSLRDVARKEGVSVNQTAKRLLKRALGLDGTVRDHRADFADLFGVWSDRELAEFQRSAGGLRKVEKEDWR